MKNILIRILYKIRLIHLFNLYGKIHINQKQYKIPVLGKMGIHNLSTWEPWMNSLLKQILPIENELFVDVGVNIGQTLLKVNSIFPDMNYIGFEPNPSCNHYLNILIEKNSIKKARVLPVGISQEDQISELVRYNNRLSDGAASIIPDFRPGNKVYGKMDIPIFKLDTVRRSIGFEKISVLKIDVEGAEYEVLCEFRNEIRKFNPIILMEILPVYNLKHKNRLIRQEGIEKLIIELDYTLYIIETEDDNYVGVKQVEKIGIHSDINRCDYILIPRSKMKKFERIAANKA